MSRVALFLVGLSAGARAFSAPGASRVSRAAVRMSDDKAVVKQYFNTEGFDRWNRIYSEDGEVNSVQKDIRIGHQQTVDKILAWIDEDASIAGKTVCDAGCGVGSLAIPLASRGATVAGSDISDAMVTEATRRAATAPGIKTKPVFSTSDLSALSGRYNTVTCVDVMIHYPTDEMKGMVAHLASLADERLIISFAPKTWYYDLLKKFGELFPGPSKTTRAYLHPEADVVAALDAAGFKLARTEMTGTNFYFSRLLEAVRV
jgi:magnesium-protoporphyrin O-methyltransferase